jgi:hypothetical protein
VQFEFPWELGPPNARYVLRDNADEAQLRVLVLGGLESPGRRAGRGRRAKRAAPDPAPVVTTRATVVRGHPIDEAAAKVWMQDPGRHVPTELAVLNRVIALHRVAAADHGVREVKREQSLVVRVGYGRGEEVADGQWTEAVEPAAAKETRTSREAALRPQERLAALLGGRDAALACEELVLRARADLDAGRLREAALQLRVALEAALAELEAWRDRADLAQRISELRDERGPVGDAANAALRGGLDDATAADVERIVSRIEAALRARTAAGWS